MARKINAGVVGAGVAAGLLAYGIVKARGGRSGEQARLRAAYPPLDTPKRVAEGLWVVDSGPMTAMGMTLPVRMTVVRLENGDLLLHSPTHFTLDLAHALAALGPVRHLVAPNIAHWTFLTEWQRTYPAATTWAAPGLRDRAQVRASGVRLDNDLRDEAPREWSGEIDQGIVSGGAGFREVYFFHRASRTLILTDLVEDLDPSKLPLVTRTVMQLAGATRGRTASYLRAVIRLGGRDAKDAARRMVALDPTRVIFAHGDWFEDRGQERLRRAFDWLLD